MQSRHIPAEHGLYKEEESDRKAFSSALYRYKDENMNNYTLSYLCEYGFLPGYALSKEMGFAKCLDPPINLVRPANVALREFAPGNYVYADRTIFRPNRVNFYASEDESSDVSPLAMISREDDIPIVLTRDSIRMEGGGLEINSVDGRLLKNMEMIKYDNISDSSERRKRVPYEIQGILLNQHSGGHMGNIGNKNYAFFNNEHIKLVNLGAKKTINEGSYGFYICPRCGATRSPFSSEEEIKRFSEIHKERCGVGDITNACLYVNMISDVLILNGFDDTTAALNVLYSILLGSSNILEMEQGDIEGFLTMDVGTEKYSVVLYDPIPGGSGFLEEIERNWKHIMKYSEKILKNCTCEKSCYKCMRNFGNQIHHDILNRHIAGSLISEIASEPVKQTDIPPVHVSRPAAVGTTDSTAEEKFLHILQKFKYPQPDKDHEKVQVSPGHFIEADFVFENESGNILIFIDGTSKSLHGGRDAAIKDKKNRALLKKNGYQVIQITAQELDDEEAMMEHMIELSVFLD